MNVWEWVMDNPILLITIPGGIIEAYLIFWLKKRGLLFFKPKNQEARICNKKDDNGNPNGQRREVRDADTNKQDKDKTNGYNNIVFNRFVSLAHYIRIIPRGKR